MPSLSVITSTVSSWVLHPQQTLEIASARCQGIGETVQSRTNWLHQQYDQPLRLAQQWLMGKPAGSVGRAGLAAFRILGFAVWGGAKGAIYFGTFVLRQGSKTIQCALWLIERAGNLALSVVHKPVASATMPPTPIAPSLSAAVPLVPPPKAFLPVKTNLLQEYDAKEIQAIKARTAVGAVDSGWFSAAHFFFGNCDTEQDLGWGCAWRSIQTCLSALGRFYTFRSLFNAVEPTAERSGANSKEWAEPGYAKRLFDALGIPGEIAFYNRTRGGQKIEGQDKTPYDPKALISTFDAFKKKLIDHFCAQKTPVMFDDGSYAACILGVRQDEDHFVLWIADPHKITKEAGLYFLALKADGKKAYSTGVDDKDGKNGLKTAQIITPERGGWMLFFPQPNAVQ